MLLLFPDKEWPKLYKTISYILICPIIIFEFPKITQFLSRNGELDLI